MNSFFHCVKHVDLQKMESLSRCPSLGQKHLNSGGYLYPMTYLLVNTCRYCIWALSQSPPPINQVSVFCQLINHNFWIIFHSSFFKTPMWCLNPHLSCFQGSLEWQKVLGVNYIMFDSQFQLSNFSIYAWGLLYLASIVH